MKKLILFLFFASGISGLIYEIVWTRIFTLTFGNTTYAISTVLTAFMAGLAAGSFIFGRIVDRLQTPSSAPRTLNSPLMLYAVLEICIGISALFVHSLISISDNFYFSILGDADPTSFSSNLIRFLLSFILLFIPTMLMGGTLPILSKYLIHRREDLGWNIGVLYAINTLGAVIGCFMTGYMFIASFGIRNTTLIGVSINIIVGIAAMAMAIKMKNYDLRFTIYDLKPHEPLSEVHQNRKSKIVNRKSQVSTPDSRLLLFFFGLSGFTSLAYEILWTRAFSLTFYSTIYLFSNILTIFLLGIAIGSFVFTKVITPLSPPFKTSPSPPSKGGRGTHPVDGSGEVKGGYGGVDMVRLFGIAEFLIGICALLSIIFFQWLPGGVNSIGSLFGEMTWQKNILTIFIIALIVMIIPTLLMGITFPLIGKLYADDLKLLGRKIGDVYSVNTLGSIAGSFSAGFLLIPLLGIQKGILLMALINLFMGIIVIAMSPTKMSGLKGAGAVSALVLIFTFGRIAMSGGDIGIGYSLNGNILFSKEDVTATVKVVEDRNSGYRTLMVNNYSLATSGDVAVRFGHIPLLLHDKPEDVLVVSLGSGITLGAVGRHPVKNIECVEIVPSTVEASRFFEKENHNIVHDPRVKLTLWDGRNYVLAAQKKYDVIISDLFQPDSAGTGNLYSVEHYRNCKDKLKKRGFMAQWLPLYQLSTEDLKVIMATFSQIFPHITVWYGDINSIKPTLLLLGSEAPLQIDISQLQEKMRQDGVLSDMLEKDNVLSFLSFFIMDEKGVSKFVAQGFSPEIINTDDKPYIEFSAPKYIWSRSQLAVRNFEELSKFRTPHNPPLIKGAGHPSSGWVGGLTEQLEKYFKGRGHIIQGRIYHAEGLFDKEMEEYRMAEMENPFDPYLAFAYFDLGYEYYIRGAYKDAVPGLEKARLINRDLKEAQFYLAKSYYQLGMKTEYEEILRQNPEFVK